MNDPSRPILTSSRFVRWAATLLALPLMGVMLSVLLGGTSAVPQGLAMGVAILGVFVLGALWLPPVMARGVFRCLCGLVFLLCAGRLAAAFAGGGGVTFNRGMGDASFSALLGFIGIGIPCFCYAAFGRLGGGTNDE